MRRLLVQSLSACSLTLLVAVNASAQASISGLVQDTTGAVLPMSRHTVQSWDAFSENATRPT